RVRGARARRRRAHSGRPRADSAHRYESRAGGQADGRGRRGEVAGLSRRGGDAVSTLAPPATPTVPRPPARVALRHRLADRGIDRQLLLLTPAAIFVILLFIYPFIYGAGLSIQPRHGGGALANYRSFFTDAYQRDTIWITLKIALPAALINVIAAVPIALR